MCVVIFVVFFVIHFHYRCFATDLNHNCRKVRNIYEQLGLSGPRK